METANFLLKTGAVNFFSNIKIFCRPIIPGRNPCNNKEPGFGSEAPSAPKAVQLITLVLSLSQNPELRQKTGKHTLKFLFTDKKARNYVNFLNATTGM